MKQLKKSVKSFAVLFLALLFVPVTVFSGDAEKLFPDVNGWNKDVGDKVYTPDNLWNLINGAADTYLLYDFKKLHTAKYTNKNDETVTVYVYKHGSPLNAYGIFSQELNTKYKLINDVGALGFQAEDAFYFITGSYYVQLSAENPKVNLRKMAEKFEATINQPNKLPEALDLLPSEGKVKKSTKYISQNFLGYKYLHSAFISKYEVGGESFKLFVMQPGSEEEKQNMLTEYLDFAEYPEDKRDKKELIVDDPYNGTIYLRKAGKFILGTMNATDKLSKKYLDKVEDKL